ncbi:ABC-type transport system ATP-binding protein [Natronomonas pharaonis DSM 2160]|uniref:ABC-type transport system ATP-binding protein n=1 Tax=Natronomonas pharaonis (strain ATCC 35678 / DSM 2160 / CIP 103997 / JCM 8858 / NBRC 14720 / NCIMB 2260 / Gabara) TaxID=348780 RepID=A0A1U7EU42_NATPD|nr:ABC transporter ATP-binding protein [Natronomonas pharaonis]CAI48465.1 ABC-type transport system ATP-binding protein [Natronomonas pharaonis DSM 2160]
MEPAIRADELRKSYGDVDALDGLSFEVDRGEFFGLLGPNGAGKTTFINILVGLVRRDGGTAEVFGFDVEDDYQEARDRIGLAPQEFNVDRFFPIHEVLEHKAGYHGVPRGEAEERAAEALQTVGIWDKRETRFDWLSGGMKRRFLLARALVTDPDLLILDEPTAGVDVQLRRELWRVIEQLNAGGTTILLTTHYIEEAERLCDRVAIVDSGSIVEVATPDDLRDRGTDQLYIRLADTPTTVPEIDIDGLVEARLDGDTLVVTAQGGSSAAPALLRTLERQGHEVLDLDIRRASLEEVFVDMTRPGEEAEELGVVQ